MEYQMYLRHVGGAIEVTGVLFNPQVGKTETENHIQSKSKQEDEEYIIQDVLFHNGISF